MGHQGGVELKRQRPRQNRTSRKTPKRLPFLTKHLALRLGVNLAPRLTAAASRKTGSVFSPVYKSRPFAVLGNKIFSHAPAWFFHTTPASFRNAQSPECCG